MRKNKKNSIGVLLEYAGKHKNLTILGCFLSAVSAVFAVLPYICIWIVARFIFTSFPNFTNGNSMIHYGWLALCFAIISSVVYFIGLMFTHLAAFRTGKNMRKTVAEHLVNIPIGYFNANQSGKLRKRIDDNASMTETLLAHQLPDMIGAIVTPFIAISLLFVFDFRMGIISLIPILFSFMILKKTMGGKSAKFFKLYQQTIEALSSEATEYVRGIPVVKVFKQTVYSFKSFYEAIINYSEIAIEHTMSWRYPLTAFTTLLNSTFLFLVPLAILLIGRSYDGLAIFVDLIFYVLFTPLCAFMMARVMYISKAVMEADEAVNKLGLILNVEPLKETDNPKMPNDNSLEFSNVTFTYPEADKPALSDVSFSIPQGKTVALVGYSGSGKSTIASLIPRFWDVQNGQVKIGGVNVKEISSNNLMEHIAFIFQDTQLFKASIFENVRAARPNATKEDVIDALNSAMCSDIIEKIQGGVDAVIGTKGVHLSGGEKQRIALARAILKDSPIVLLDEATAFSDPENEVLILKAFKRLAKGKTVLMIAHRLSTVQNVDAIIVMKEGKVEEQGTHKELLEKQGVYFKMWNEYRTSIQWKIGKEA